ncbi:MAG: hypothetical protein U1E53_08405 [Dongiaceae bacterium]
MDVVAYLVQAYNFLLTLIGVILRAVVGPLGWILLVVLLAGLAIGLLMLRRRAP